MFVARTTSNQGWSAGRASWVSPHPVRRGVANYTVSTVARVRPSSNVGMPVSAAITSGRPSLG